MKLKKLGTNEIIHFYICNIFSSNFFCRTFSENIFLQFSLNFNSIFLLLKLLIYDFNASKESEWLIIYTKKPIYFFSKILKKKNIVKLLETKIKIAICSTEKIFKLLEENIKWVLNANKKKKIEKVIFHFIFEIIKKKMTSVKLPNLSRSILSLVYSFVCSNFDCLDQNMFDLLEWTISEFLLIISNFNLIYLGQHHTKCVLLCQKIFDEIKNKTSSKKKKFSAIVEKSAVFSSFYFSNCYPHLYKKIFWYNNGNFENSFLMSIQNFEGESILFLPIFLGFFFSNTEKNEYYFNSSNISFLNLIFLSDSFERIFFYKKIEAMIYTIGKTLLQIKSSDKNNLDKGLKFFSIEEKFGYTAKRFYIHQIFDTFDLRTKKKMISSYKGDQLVMHLTFSNVNLNSKINALYQSSLVFGDFLKGIMINKYTQGIKYEILKIIDDNLITILKEETCYVIDFICSYRYQLPIKKVFYIGHFILKNITQGLKINGHVLFLLERILCLRGNDGNGLQLLKVSGISSLENMENFYVNRKNVKSTNFLQEINSKLFMRFIISINNIQNGEFDEIRENFILNFLNEIETKTFSNKFKIFILESIFFILQYPIHISTKLELYMENFGHIIGKKNQKENLPYLLEIFSELLMQSKNAFLNSTIKNLFLSICTPYPWYNEILFKPMVKFLEAFVFKFSNLHSNINIVEILKILNFIFQRQKKLKSKLFFRLMNIFCYLKNFSACLPHMLEILEFLANPIQSVAKQDVLLKFLMVLFDKLEFLRLKKIFDKVKKNALFLLIDRVKVKFDCDSALLETRNLYINIQENMNLERQTRFRKIFKILVRKYITSSWIIKKVFQKYNYEIDSCFRFNVIDANDEQVRNLKFFFELISAKLSQLKKK